MRALAVKAVSRLRHVAGVDGAVGYTALARVCSIVSSVGNVLLLVKFLSPIEQGYYYTLLSLVLLQSVLELGFSFVIQQYAAHESVHCVLFRDGRVEGDETAHSRLASVLQLAARWYLVAAIAIAVVLLPVGSHSSRTKRSSRPCRLAGPMDCGCNGDGGQFSCRADLFLSGWMRPDQAGCKGAIQPGGCCPCRVLGNNHLRSRPLCACHGECGYRGDCNHLSFPAPKTSIRAVELFFAREGCLMAIRDLAFSMETCGQLVLHLFHRADVYSGTLPRAGAD